MLCGCASSPGASDTSISPPGCSRRTSAAPVMGAMSNATLPGSAQAGNRLTLAGGGMGCAGGRLRWIGGGNSGLSERIVAGDADGVVLARVPVFDGVGALVEVGEGCDGTLGTCRDRFGNVANFRGEPHLPGIDLLTRYPGA